MLLTKEKKKLKRSKKKYIKEYGEIVEGIGNNRDKENERDMKKKQKQKIRRMEQYIKNTMDKQICRQGN